MELPRRVTVRIKYCKNLGQCLYEQSTNAGSHYCDYCDRDNFRDNECIQNGHLIVRKGFMESFL